MLGCVSMIFSLHHPQIDSKRYSYTIKLNLKKGSLEAETTPTSSTRRKERKKRGKEKDYISVEYTE